MEKLLVEAAVRRFFAEEVERQGADCTQLSPRALAWLEAKIRVLVSQLVRWNKTFKRATVTEDDD